MVVVTVVVGGGGEDNDLGPPSAESKRDQSESKICSTHIAITALDPLETIKHFAPSPILQGESMKQQKLFGFHSSGNG